MMSTISLATVALLALLLLFNPLPTQGHFHHHHHHQRWWGLQFRGGAATVPEPSAIATTTTSTTTTTPCAIGVIVLSTPPTGETEHSILPDTHLSFIRDACESSSMANNNSNNTTASFSCLIFDPTMSTHTPSFRIDNLPDDDILSESLSLLCDFLVIVLPEHNNNNTRENNNGGCYNTLSKILPGLSTGAERRVTIDSLSKSRMIVVSPTIAPNNNETWWKDQIVQQELATVTPNKWEQFEVVSLPELEHHWKDWITEFSIEAASSSSSSSMASDDMELFPTLLRQVYRSLGGTNDSQSSFQCTPQLDDVTAPSTVLAPDPQPQRPRRRHHHHEDNLSSSDPHLIVQETLSTAQRQLEKLEAKMDEVWLEPERHSMPLLEFGDTANGILNDAYDRLGPPLPAALRMEMSLSVASQLRRLYKTQLNTLRDYYGKRYETVLEATTKEGETDKDWGEAAAHLTETFRAAAQHAIPMLCREGGELRDADFEYVSTMQGLITDMMEVTQLREAEQSLAMLDDDDDDEDSVKKKKKRRLPKWCKKMFARAVSLGINYLQGWLAWQGVKRAAIERDKNMPKFPLF